jgi:ERCC4-type nuclease
MKTHKIPTPTRLVIDHREPGEMVDLLRGVRNLEVEIGTLDSGDYVVPDCLVIERKTVTDFVTSIVEDKKRLFHQTEAMSRAGTIGVLLIEGDLYAQQRMTIPEITGTLSYLAVIQRISILPTLSLRHSALTIAKLVRHAVHGLGYDLGLRGAAPRDPAAAALFFLQGVTTVSAKKAIALLRHFGSVAAIAAASETELTAVAGIGPKTAPLIHAVFHAQANLA